MEEKIVWIADDDADDRLMIKEAFLENKHQHILKFFLNGEEIIRDLKRIKNTEIMPSLIILDLNMPKINGMEVLRFIRNNVYTQNTPVVILTTSKSEEDKKKALSEGANDYITKPYRFLEMLKIVQHLTNFCH